MAREYQVSVPVMGIAQVTVIADSDKDAIDQAIDLAGPDEVNEWQTFRAVVEGNVFYGPLNRARIDDSHDLDDGE